ncbi:septation protein SepH [Phytoactinopolyspora mesophila]|uniref:DUF3071 domain-containing protein n=1 Tax=Phytoactinopolyspora mesophila TaxID=2650750 RepID=A0A7K3LZ53_9ACTN|nr:septation protein SepH [Phytoactinopolyspora mesophila]NDL56304.1 DUF3071 domain-containing protein [Phytoactinopolyspora mesophila]
MRELRVTAVSEDGAYLILSDGHEQFALRADERVHAAIRGDRARLGQLDIQLESQLRPRDIQARIRAGESVESVAAAATMPLEKVRRFAGPVLAEREHIAQRARQANLRRITGEGPVRTLEGAAADHAAAVGAQPEALTWDAWRADDGRWRVRCSWPAEGEETPDDDPEFSAVFTFDPSGRSVAPLDVNARVVAGEPRPEPEPEPAPEPVSAGPARLSVVHPPANEVDDDDESLHDDPFDVEAEPAQAPITALVRNDADPADLDDPEDHEHTTPIEPVRRPRRTGRYGRPERRRRELSEPWAEEQEPEEPAEDVASTDRLRLSDIATRIEVEEPDEPESPEELAPTAQEPPPPTPPPRSTSSRSRRPSVPSWDEIMFGRRKND